MTTGCDRCARLDRVEEIRRRACEILGAGEHESLTEAAARVVRERDALRAHTAPATVTAGPRDADGREVGDGA